MARLKPVKVPCPECGEKVDVPITDESRLEGDTLIVTFTPDMTLMAEHYTEEHVGQEVSEP